jgi:hypothetical protein
VLLHTLVDDDVFEIIQFSGGRGDSGSLIKCQGVEREPVDCDGCDLCPQNMPLLGAGIALELVFGILEDARWPMYSLGKSHDQKTEICKWGHSLYLLTDPFHINTNFVSVFSIRFFGEVSDITNLHGLGQESQGRSTTDRGTGRQDPNRPNS